MNKIHDGGIGELLRRLGADGVIYVEIFGSNILTEITLDTLKAWVMFLSQPGGDAIVMIFNPKIPVREIAKMKTMIDDFCGTKAYPCSAANRDLACVWEDGNYDLEFLKKVVAEAAKKNPGVWTKLFEKIS